MHKTLILTLFLFSFGILYPIQFMISNSYLSYDASYNPNLAQPVVLRMSTSAQIITGNWDPVITDGYNILETYKKNCLEPLFWLPDDSIEPKSHLATTWEYKYWPENEINSKGFNNSGGVKAINITLREGVQFHDGSSWNATVAKWNIDRLFVITGNLTGNANGIYDQRNAGGYWIDVKEVMPYFTASWNLSEYDAPDMGGEFEPPDPSRYAYYYLSDPDGPDPVIVNNSNPYGGWDPVFASWIHYAPYDKFPLIRWVEVVEDLPSGGKIRVHFNNWNLFNVQDLVWTPQISMQAYRIYNETGYYGYNTGLDMIGTGAYIYGEHNEIADNGYMLKNENYWNKTALEADGWFSADRVEIIQFPHGDLGKDAQNIALLTHSIDYAFDTMTMPIDYDAVMANPDINYIEYGVSDYITQITLNCINETWWSGGVMYPGEPSEFNFSWVDINSWFPQCSADPAANGIPRILREALNYAFDYNTYINVDMEGRIERTGGMLGTESVYYNSSIPLANYNLEYAREILLNLTSHDIYSLTDIVWSDNAWNHNFSNQLAMRGITDPSDNPTNNVLWQTVAATNPIFIINFYWDDAHQDLADKFELACNNLGFAIVQDADNKAPAGNLLWDHCISSYWTNSFDGVHSIWSAQAWMMDYAMPKTIPEGWVEANYGDPNRGSWRMGFVTQYWPEWNFAFCYDDEVDYWLERVEYGNQMEKLKWLSKIAEKEQNELFPMIYVSQGKEGRVLWNDWEMNFNRGDLFFANFRYVALPPSPPGDVALDSDAGTPDIDGSFNLIWNVSLGADNYSLYRYGSEITEINGSLVLNADQDATTPFPISGLSDGEYYFVVVAHNQYGDTMSNNFHITVQVSQDPPPSFILSSDADFPDDDGFFNLSWAYPDGADNYSLYMHNQQITVIDSSLTLLKDQTATSPFSATGLSNGEYYFVVVAHNKYGDTLSNNVHITVNIPGEPTETVIFGYNTLVICCITIFSAVILFNKRKKKIRLR